MELHLEVVNGELDETWLAAAGKVRYLIPAR